VEVIHFTVGATDPLPSLLAHGARSVPLAEGNGQTRLSCLHLAAGSQLSEPLATYDCALLLVHGHVIFTMIETEYLPDPTILMRLDMYAGMGLVVKSTEHYTLESVGGAILLAVESPRLDATLSGISTPARIAGQRWPSEDLPKRLSLFRR
jgi:hypothetical protein